MTAVNEMTTSTAENFGSRLAEDEFQYLVSRPKMARYAYEGNWSYLLQYGRELATSPGVHLEGGDVYKFAEGFANAYIGERKAALARSDNLAVAA